jgi:Protein of unknown function (DUF3164)
MKITEQKTTEAFWTDEKGIQIPFNRTTKLERAKEKSAIKLAGMALKIQEGLLEFKKQCIEACEKAYQADLKEGKAPSKGGYTLFNFDKSIKVERSLNENITFDENLIGAAKEKFDEFLQAGTEGVDEMVRALIMDAFSSNKKGKLDSKKIMGLLSYKERISEKKYPHYHEAIKLIEQSIRRPDSRIYYRIWIKDETNAYKQVDLNFSSL